MFPQVNSAITWLTV